MGDDCKIYVGSLSYQTDNNSLASHFEKIGKVAEAMVVRERDTGKSRGFGFVTFFEARHVDEAIEKLTDSDLDGRQIKVSKANSLSGGGFRGRGGGRGGGFGGRGSGGYGQRHQGGGGFGSGLYEGISGYGREGSWGYGGGSGGSGS